MNKRNIGVVVGVMTLAIAGQAQAAVPFAFERSEVSITDNGRTCFPTSGCALRATTLDPADFSLDAGGSQTFRFAEFSVTPGFGGDSNAKIEATLKFSSPDVLDVTSGATVSYLRLGGFFTPGVVAGSITWSDPTQFFSTSNGSLFSVTFNDLSGIVFGSSAFGTATVALTRDGSGSVPEPASWMMMLAGFGCAGFALRRQRAQVSFA
jgi:hypothetical protein